MSSGGSRLEPLVIAAIVTTLLSWASAFIVIRGSGADFSAGGLALGRMLVGSAALGVLCVGKRWIRPTRREVLMILAFGALWFGAYNVLLGLAEQTLDAGTTALIVGIGPILIALGGGLILREGISRWLVIGTSVAFAGVVLIGISNGVRGFHLLVGVVAAVLAALTYAAGVLFQKPVLRRLPVSEVTFLGALAGAAVCLPFAGPLISDVATAPIASTLGVVYLGVVPTAIAFTTWGYALSRMPAGQLGVTTYLVPPLVILAGLVVFQEVPTVTAIIGGVLCLVGVGLSRRRPSLS
ncbi:DMT family transporter [Naasia lichenicola]|uniref:DMT family transporter n=1 Tax=Naasia lichenicola TaxID=2565933 RepID=A0A4S4FP88_9MICO|nr:DMT family transporter [Naasia lichenicola]